MLKQCVTLIVRKLRLFEPHGKKHFDQNFPGPSSYRNSKLLTHYNYYIDIGLLFTFYFKI
jgi:hypothetical protein